MGRPPPPEPAAAADLAVRPAEERDIGACLRLLQGRLAYPDLVLALLPRAWRRLLRDDALNTTIVEARDADGGTVVAGYGASVFVADAWMAAARHSRTPFLTARTIRRELAGRSPILRPEAVARANDDGLNVLILHYGEARELPAAARPALRYRMFEALVETHRGCRVKDVVQEFWDEIDAEYVIHGWGRVLTDYAAWFRRRGEALPPLGRRPHLVGITRPEVIANPGALAAPLFVYVAPRLGFTRAEQRLLGEALGGRTDIELARRLGIALATVKSRWRAIYDRVGRVAPEVIPAVAPADRRSGSRGREKRRQLIAYLSRHPEELRPVQRRMSRHGSR